MVGFAKRRGSTDHGEKVPFNNSFGKLERLNLWWETAGKAKIENMLDAYYNALENIYTELYAHVTQAERKEIDAELKDIESFLDERAQQYGFDGVTAQNRRVGSNKCDQLARKLSALSAKYNLEWFDIAKWSKDQKDAEPVMRG